MRVCACDFSPYGGCSRIVFYREGSISFRVGPAAEATGVYYGIFIGLE